MTNARVLIVDDNPVDRALLAAILKKAGMTFIQEAENGRVGAYKVLTAAQVGHKFHLVFVDLNMPAMNGLQLIRTLRSQSETESSLIIMLTGSSDRETVAQAREAGVDAFIVKPLVPHIVETKVKELLKIKS